MTTGDGGDLSPMLPQPSDDNAPMISGRGTKIIADARGAYLAGNLRALIDQMDDFQRLQFRVSLVQQALSYLEQLCVVEPNSPQEYAIQAMRRWLGEPTNENAQQPLSILLEAQVVEPFQAFNGGTQQEVTVYASQNFHTRQIRIAIVTLTEDDLRLAALAVQRLSTEEARETGLMAWETQRREEHIAKRWQIDAAWRILLGTMPHEIETFVQTDLLGAYRSGDLRRLWSEFNQQQALDFRRANLRLALRYVEAAIPHEPAYTEEWNIIDSAYQWLNDPTFITLRPLHGVREIMRSRPASSLGTVWGLLFLINKRNLHSVVLWTRASINMASIVAYQLGTKSWSRLWEVTPWWQVEAAWAILHNTQMPPFELPS